MTSASWPISRSNGPGTREHLPEALQIANDAVLLADQSPGRLGHRFPVHIPRGYVLVEFDRLDEARSTIESGLRLSEELGIGWRLPVYYAVRALERFLAGHWDDAVAEIETDTGLPGAPGESYHRLLLRHGVLSLIRRLYVSRRTVQTHLAHVFAKLRITSRSQLAAEAIRTGGNEPGDATGREPGKPGAARPATTCCQDR